MIEVFEQYGFYEERRAIIIDNQKHIDILRTKSFHERQVQRKGQKHICYRFDCVDDGETIKFNFQSSYFIGIDWIVENELPIYIQPKLNSPYKEIDYIGMLLAALQEPENLKHLEDLIYIDFHKPYILITQKQDILSPFLIAQFLQVLKKIVQKGLKKSYYQVTENLNARIKGKVLVSSNIKRNMTKGRLTHSVCQFQEYGVNCEENKILKKAYLFSRRVIQQYKGFDTQFLSHILDYVHPAFEFVSDDVDIVKIKNFKSNPLFKEYDQAIKLALIILKRFSYNITQTEQREISTPPFWIDMSKLFELYVFKKLKEAFPERDEVTYHYTVQGKELDFLINSPQKGVQMVVDTKYKPRYYNGSVDLEDYRQISGYARLKSVYEKLETDYRQNIDCLIIYPNQTGEHLEKIDLAQKESLPNYVRFYKLGVQLREINKSKE